VSDTRYGFYQKRWCYRGFMSLICVNYACNLSMSQLLHFSCISILKMRYSFSLSAWLMLFTIVSCSMATFRDKSINKWQRMTQVTTGAAAIKGKLHAFNQVKFCDWTEFLLCDKPIILLLICFVLQDISHQVAAYMRDPSRMIKQMQLRRSAIKIFGSVSQF